MDGGGFEPPKQFAADLQSVPFGHSGIHPYHKASALTMWHFSICHLKMQALCQRTSVLKMIKFISADKKLMISDTKVSDRIPLNFFVFDSMVDSTGRNRLLQPCMVSPFSEESMYSRYHFRVLLNTTAPANKSRCCPKRLWKPMQFPASLFTGFLFQYRSLRRVLWTRRTR